MLILFLVALISGLLLGVRLMFFGAERRRQREYGGVLLRRSEPAVVAFLVMFGLAGYLALRHTSLPHWWIVVTAAALGAGWAVVVTWLAIATARLEPAHDQNDPRFVHQGQVAVVAERIPESGEGAITYWDGVEDRRVRARGLDGEASEPGQEVCIERIEDGVAFVEPWASVERRL